MEKSLPNQISSAPDRSGEVPPPTRDESIVEWLPLVRLIGRNELRRLGGLPALLATDLDDVVQSGVLELIAAIDHFDPALSASETYFARRIRWAMPDLPRSFPYFKDGEAFKRKDQDLLRVQPLTCGEIERVEVRVELGKLVGQLPDQHRQVILALMYGGPAVDCVRADNHAGTRVADQSESFWIRRRRLSRETRRSHRARPAFPAMSRAGVSWALANRRS